MSHNANILLFLLVLLCTPATDVYGSPAYESHAGGGISFRYSTSIYSRTSYFPTEPACKSNELPCLNLFHIRLHRTHTTGGTQFDSGSACWGSIDACSDIPRAQNYWIGPEGEVRISDPTAAVTRREMGKWVVYEAFSLCGWTRSTGEYFPYGGQCYSAVLASQDKTVEFTFLLGEAGCRKIEKCWRTKLNSLRYMLSSVE
ncbi:hypothetical protein LLG90_03415 [Aromatoleum toluclasticum]|uniref:hypothetical protein n=1 Tax=Aromatoleum toluclasticum TaxID=92003 RepID=UPI001D18B824|nr:hypothetical protein [Aromatoleum toluclasticum]MCC4114396.1 hypothetical protein [Aromatoleum toluclasticum]